MVSVSVMSREPEEASNGNSHTIHDYATDGRADEIAALCALAPEVINQKDEYGFTPLHLAADRGHLGVVSLLLQNGADPSIKDSDEQTAIELARCAEHSEIVQMLSTHQNTSIN